MVQLYKAAHLDSWFPFPVFLKKDSQQEVHIEMRLDDMAKVKNRTQWSSNAFDMRAKLLTYIIH